ncbi:ATP-binding protein [Hydrogenophaga taeniospiralis]|uniref:HAMP domain-containing sensor histidine kinase n=1 Tax=Hydrogenophaga taeniospiralis TaxID=65656 RepID=UPI001CFB2CEA|nr:ATP-binding protein [Hydrogenophaga taeniospiralis]UCU92731.1 HAMP domain-containing protein [Hydrogenophaga taeniospiralis]
MSPRASNSSWKRAKHRLAHSIKLRMVLVFLLLAAAMTFVFITGAQKAFSIGWREAARPLLMDYVDHLVADITVGGGAPDLERARAITARLPLTVRITGPQVNWASHPDQSPPDWLRDNPDDQDPRDREDGGGGKDWQRIFKRSTADGHSIEFGINGEAFERRPRMVGYALTALLVLTLLAFLYVRRLLRPLDAIQAGARRFGAGDFSQPIPERCLHGPDELGELAATINTMGQDIRQMLDAKRALLLAISHELRSPLTRARLNTELLPETAEVNPQREALLRDLQEMARLITDLLESERLAANHAALQREPVALEALAREVIGELQARHPEAARIALHAAPDLPTLQLDPARMRLLLRNLLDNALRHSAGAPLPPELHLSTEGQGIRIEVRDHGPGVPEEQIPHLAEPFFRPDTARTRSQGGVGLGLYLCKLVAQAHGGTFAVRNALPGLAVQVVLPPR